MRVVAIQRGYFGGEIRDADTKFEVPDEIMADDELRPSWVDPVKTVLMPVDVIDDDEDGEEEPKAKRGRKPRAKVEEAKADDNPGDIEGAKEATGGNEPDWVRPDFDADEEAK